MRVVLLLMLPLLLAACLKDLVERGKWRALTVDFDHCKLAGENGLLCVNKEEDITFFVSDKPQHPCYQVLGRCVVLASGQCGWEQTPSLKRCMLNTSRAQPKEGL